MGDYGERPRRRLEGYEKVLWEKALKLPKHQPHLVRWVEDFLLSAGEHGEYSFEQMLDLFLAGLEGEHQGSGNGRACAQSGLLSSWGGACHGSTFLATSLALEP